MSVGVMKDKKLKLRFQLGGERRAAVVELATVGLRKLKL
jgi:hypothetical protein